MNGIDVSKHNGVIDWQSVKASGKVDFVCRVQSRA
jgi:GH25 family lysozyme M1 (1,4-beta-N-acetylmuramidase)